MDWANPIDPIKSTQSNPKKWVGTGYWVDMDFKMSGFIQPDPLLKWVVILLNPIQSTLYGSNFGFA
jgi:hypothetical protein